MTARLRAALAAGYAAGALLAAGAGGEPRDPRSAEVLRLDCAAGPVRSDLTLFGNGTLRLREGEAGAEELHLAELGRDVFDAYVRRLRAEALDDGLAPPPSVDGPWTQSCVLTLDVPAGPAGSVGFSGFDSLSLPLARVVAIARELTVVARTSARVAGLDPAYEPVAGDVLLHRDGSRYRVHGLTADGRGVELTGIEQPLTLYVPLEALTELFLGLEETRRW
ncbi:MAG: hypothetical protein OES32_12065 [Acidobacteriota bacterium]|nr:hypothetical protein [Acidobacteriota bacterium]MDH3524311.1 hypothetical protein [Acidobacteriota bacterium]